MSCTVTKRIGLDVGKQNAAIDTGNGQNSNRLGTGPPQNGGGGACGCARGEHVIHEQYTKILDFGSPGEGKCAGHILAPCRASESGLLRRGFAFPEEIAKRRMDSFRDTSREQSRLIEAAAEEPPPVQRHRCDDVELAVQREAAGEQFAERRGQRADSLILVEMDQFAERAVVVAERIGIIEAVQALAAEGAKAAFIEREPIEEWCAAGGAEVLGGERLDRFQAFFADGDAREIGERGATDAAIVRQDYVEKGRASAGRIRPDCQW